MDRKSIKLGRLLGRGKPEDETARLLAAPLNDPALVERAFGSARPGPERVAEKYFGLPPGERPALSPYFDAGFYQNNNPDVHAARIDPYLHFLAHGIDEGRNPHPLIDLDSMRAQAELEGVVGPWSLDALSDFLRRNPHFLEEGGSDVHRARPELTGSFDLVADGVAMGWAFDPQRPDSRLGVEIVELLDNEVRVVGRGRAAGARADLLNAGIGDGCYHFSIPLSDEIADGQLHRLQARVGGGWLTGLHDFVAPSLDRGFEVLPDADTRALARVVSSSWPRQDAEQFVRRMAQANLMLASRGVAGAIQELRAMEGRFPENALQQLKLAEAQMRLGNFEAAAALYSAAAGSELVGGWALLGLGDCRQMLGRVEEAEECYRQATGFTPPPPPLASRVGQAGCRGARQRARERAAAGDLQGALALLMPEFMSNPDDPEICDTVIDVLDSTTGQDGRAAELSPAMARAERSRRLLEVAVAHAHNRLGRQA